MNATKMIRTLLRYINLDAEVDSHDKIHEIIEKDVVFKGTNLWILIFAILVASVGLNINSTAVIIGAMLISPLMGPITGVGYSIATYNFPLFSKAVRNYTFAVAASLFASTVYFALTPISTAHSELLARTSPTIYDVLIAFFGGLAGIVAISSKQKGNVIPGVAIATALMPPLCTAGYGLATGQFNFFFGAIYLFTINSVFISMAALLVSQILKLPIRAQISDSQKKKINRIISLVGILILVPSLYFGYQLVQKEKFIENATLFVKSVSSFEGNFLLRHDINPSTKTITLAYGGRTFTDREKGMISGRMKDYSLHKTNIIFQQGLSIDQLDEKHSEVENLKMEINNLQRIIEEKSQQLDKLHNRKLFGKQLLNEANSLFPRIVSVSFSESSRYETKRTIPEDVNIVIFGTNDDNPDAEEHERIRKWLMSRLNTTSVEVFYE